MKRFLIVIFCLSFATIGLQAQKFALIDMEYILKNIPAYERANEQMSQQSKRWQGEIEELAAEAEALYKKYQGESAFLSDEQRAAREEEILEKEKSLKEKEKAKKQVLLRLSPSLWNELAKWADDDFRSINGQIEYLLAEAVRNRRK